MDILQTDKKVSFVRPTFVENLYNTLFQLEPDRPYYYLFVVRIGKNIFMALGFDELNEKLDKLIKEQVELPLQSQFVSVIHAFYNPRFMMSKRAYTKVGDSIDYREVTRYEIMMRLEIVKDFIYDEVVKLSPYIRFTKPTMALT